MGMQLNTLADIQLLIENKIEESITLEYKRELDAENREIAKDISAFANTDGGSTIVYGVASRDRIPNDIHWIVSKGIEERIQNVAMTAIQPRLAGIQVIRLQNSTNNSEAAYAVSIPKSPHAPHMVSNRYYNRRGSVSSPMEDSEVRNAIFGAGHVKALRYEISLNIELAERTHKLIDQIYNLPPEKRQSMALIPLHADAWNSVIASGLLFALESSLAERLVAIYGYVHEINSLVTWVNSAWNSSSSGLIAHTPADLSSSRGGTYLPSILRDKLGRLIGQQKEVLGLLV